MSAASLLGVKCKLSDTIAVVNLHELSCREERMRLKA